MGDDIVLKVDNKIFELAEKFNFYKDNPIDFIEDCIMIPTPGGDELLKLYDPQKRVLNDFFNNHFLILLKSRQTGFSTLSQCIMTYLCTFYDNVVMGILSRDGSEASDFCRKVEDMIDKLPVWIRPKYKTKSVQSFILANGCQVWSTAVSQANPGAVFRGKALTFLVIDEAAHIMKINEAWTGVAPALSKTQMKAQALGIPYGTIFLSTPNKKEGHGKWFFQNWMSAKNKESIFIPHKIHWTEIPDFRDSPTWYKTQCSILGNDPRRIAQEMELKFVGSENTLFSEKVQEKLQEPKTEPIKIIEYAKGSELWQFKEPRQNKFHLIGVDTASEVGGSDYQAIQVIEYETMEQVLEFRGKVSVKRFSEIVRHCARLCPHNILIIESNSYGNQVIEEIAYDTEYEYNIFGENTGSGKTSKFKPGLSTNVRTRPLIVDALYNYVNEDPELIVSERLALELVGLTENKKKIEAEAGSHDDLAMAYGFCCYARHYAPNLLGNSENLAEIDDGETTYADDGLKLIRDMNNPSMPLRYSYEDMDYDNFQRDLEYFIKDSAGNQLKGMVNVLDLFGGNPIKNFSIKK